jgi:exopolyphosphatase/guanosine-5'-triphosphate,3'-diphosphate pyrophosphatase
MKENRSFSAPVAVIDIGTNTLRLLIGTVVHGSVHRLASGRSVTRLGKNLQSTGKLSDESIKKSIASLRTFKETGDHYKVRDYRAVGTSALREAANSNQFLDEVKRNIGISIDIISGEREAELTIKGIITNEDHLQSPALILDIGGGSTEWIVVDRNDYSKSSIPLGAVRLYESFIRQDPPSPEETRAVKKYISEQVTESFLKYSSARQKNTVLPSFATIIATGGTATTAAAVDLGLEIYDGNKIHSHRISLPTLREVLDTLVRAPLADRSRIKGLEPERADIIIPGMLILETIMEMLQTEEVLISDYGLLEGLLVESFNSQ